MNNNIYSKRNYSIDIFKFVLAILIVAMHTSPFNSISKEANLIFENVFCTLGVPFFIMCTGYFLGKKFDFDNDKVVQNQNNKTLIFNMMKKLAILYFGWTLVYLIFSVPNWIKTGWLSFNAFKDFGLSVFTIGSHYHLWYLLSVLYALLILYFIVYYINRKYYLIIAIILYAVDVYIYAYSSFLPNSIQSILIKLQSFCIVVAVIRVLPFLLLGMYISNKSKYKSIHFYMIGFLAFVLLSLLEIYLGKTFLQSEKFSNIITTLPRAFCLFMISLKMNDYIKKPLHKYLVKANIVIYCIHPLILETIKQISPNINSLLLFIFTSVISIVLSVAYYGIKDKVRNKS